MTEITIHGLTKKFGKVVAVDEADMTFDSGRISVVVGPSGCGKTTLMRLIAGLEAPTSGSITFDDKPIDDVATWDRNVAMVFQNYSLYPHMKVWDNIAFPLKTRKFSKDEVRQRVQRAAELLNIDQLLERKPKQLSGGQRQRVALGRAVVRKPDVFLMDEPFSNLDQILRVEMRKEVRDLQRDLGTTTIFVTHDQIEAMTLADKLIVMNNGQIQQAGEARDVFNYPANIFVGSFLGNRPMNFIPVLYDPDTHMVYNNLFQRKLPPPMIESLNGLGYTVTEMMLGLRPEYLHTSLTETEEGIPIKIDMVEPMGKDTIIVSMIEGERVRSIVPPYTFPEVGDTAWMSFEDRDMHLFNAITEEVVAQPPRVNA